MLAEVSKKKAPDSHLNAIPSLMGGREHQVIRPAAKPLLGKCLAYAFLCFRAEYLSVLRTVAHQCCIVTLSLLFIMALWTCGVLQGRWAFSR